MPFIDSAQSMRAKTHASDTSTPVLVGVLALAGIAAVFFVSNIVTAASGVRFELGEKSSAPAMESTSAAALPTASNSSSSVDFDPVYVFVSGAVAEPGVYALEPGSRVGDAIHAAGGFAEGAALEYNNLARVASDGEQIHVPLEEDLVQGSYGLREQGAAPVPPSAASVSGAGLVNINTASQAELESLPGIGPSTAAKIIASRESEGAFPQTEDLMRVSGIGEKKYASLEGLICV